MKTTTVKLTQRAPGLLMDVEITRPDEKTIELKDVAVRIELNPARLDISLTLPETPESLVNALQFDL